MKDQNWTYFKVKIVLQILEYRYELDIVSNSYLNSTKYSLLLFKSQDLWFFTFFHFRNSWPLSALNVTGWEFCKVFSINFGILWKFLTFFKVSQKQRLGPALTGLRVFKKVKQISNVVVKRKKIEPLLLFCWWWRTFDQITLVSMLKD